MDSTSFVDNILTSYREYYTTNFTELNELLTKHIISEKTLGTSSVQRKLIIKLAEYYEDILTTVFNLNIDDDMKYPVQTINLVEATELRIQTTITTPIYNVEVRDSDGNYITCSYRITQEAGVYVIYLYSEASISNLSLYILY